MEPILSPTQSPTPSKQTALFTSVKQMNFYDALKEIMGGKKVARLEWKDKEYYGVLNETRLQLHKPDGKLYDWVLIDGDVSGVDWIII